MSAGGEHTGGFDQGIPGSSGGGPEMSPKRDINAIPPHTKQWGGRGMA
jgi:hypothetical protein